jgi:hypothetical protein
MTQHPANIFTYEKLLSITSFGGALSLRYLQTCRSTLVWKLAGVVDKAINEMIETNWKENNLSWYQFSQWYSDFFTEKNV